MALTVITVAAPHAAADHIQDMCAAGADAANQWQTATPLIASPCHGQLHFTQDEHDWYYRAGNVVDAEARLNVRTCWADTNYEGSSSIWVRIYWQSAFHAALGSVGAHKDTFWVGDGDCSTWRTYSEALTAPGGRWFIHIEAGSGWTGTHGIYTLYSSNH
jgi:hypothetical protein